MMARKTTDAPDADNRPARRPVPATVLIVSGIVLALVALGILGFIVPQLLMAGVFAVWAAALLLLLLLITALLPLPAAYLFHRRAPGMPRELAWIVSLLFGTFLLFGLLRLISTPLSGIEESRGLSEGQSVHMERQPMFYLLLVPAMIGSLAVFYYVIDREP